MNWKHPFVCGFPRKKLIIFTPPSFFCGKFDLKFTPTTVIRSTGFSFSSVMKIYTSAPMARSDLLEFKTPARPKCLPLLMDGGMGGMLSLLYVSISSNYVMNA